MDENKMFKQKAFEKDRKLWLPGLHKIYQTGDWVRFSEYVQGRYEIMQDAFKLYYGQMPEKYRRDFVVGCYMHHGDHYPCCRMALRRLPKNGINELPKRFAKKDVVEIWRAGNEEEELAKYRISWTTSYKVANDFYRSKHYLYRGEIRPCDIIAYTNEREEHEVMQYNKVRNVELYDMHW